MGCSPHRFLHLLGRPSLWIARWRRGCKVAGQREEWTELASPSRATLKDKGSQESVFDKAGFCSEQDVLDSFSTQRTTFEKLKRKGAFFGFVLSTPQGRNYFVKRVSPFFAPWKETQFIYHLGSRLGIKLSSILTTMTPIQPVVVFSMFQHRTDFR